MPIHSMDLDFMAEAIELAMRPIFSPLPNPRVGAVIVYRNQIIAKGFHERAGEPHAEALAIREAEKKKFRAWTEAELYVNLEPCCHTEKRTPPCLPLILSKKFKRVIIANLDPNPKVSGRSVKALKKAGVDVEVGVLKDLALFINQTFIKNQKEKLPYVTLKMATTFDGKWADEKGRSQWITSPAARLEAHRFRAEVDAIAIGKGTIESDNPSLNVRLKNQKPRARKIVIFGKPKNFSPRLKVMEANGKDHVIVLQNAEKKNIKKTLSDLYLKHGICHLLVEGGPELASSFLKEGAVDEIVQFMGKGFLGGSGKYSIGKSWPGAPLEKAVVFQPNEARMVGPDVIIQGFVKVFGDR